ncbi:MAG: hypothetical protein AB7V15_02240 [Acidimicrobiia bacterium]
MTGVVNRQGDIVELCERPALPCAGLILAGDTDIEDGAWSRYRGRLVDGVLSASGDVEPYEPVVRTPPRQLLAAPCIPDAGVRGGGIGEDALLDRANAERDFAGTWFDHDSGIQTLAFTGDLDRHRRELTRFGDAVCVVRRTYTLVELERAHDILRRVLGPALRESGTDVVGNRIHGTFGVLDAPNAERLGTELGRLGGALVLTGYLALLSGTIDDLEPPPVADRGGPVLAVQPWGDPSFDRSSGGGVLTHDAERDCLFLAPVGANGPRTLPVWPYGYHTARDPIRVFDADGDLVALVGERLSLRGRRRAVAAGEAACGAEAAFVMGYPTPASGGGDAEGAG